MNYEQLIRDAWSLTWRFRFLWLLGLFAATSVGSCSGASGGPMQWQMRAPPSEIGPNAFDRIPAEIQAIVADAMARPGLIAAIVAFALLIGIIWFAVSLIAQGGMAEATADVARGRPITSSQAWGAGLHFFWRYLLLWLFLIVVAILFAAVLGALVVLASISFVSFEPSTPRLTIGLVVIIPVILVAFAASILISIVVAYAQRAIVVDDTGPVDALKVGWNVLRAHFGDSLILWLLSLVLGICAAIITGLALAGVALVLAIPGLLIWAAVGLTGPTWAYVALGLVVVIAAALTLGAITNTFFWNLWTLAFLRLSTRSTTSAS